MLAMSFCLRYGRNENLTPFLITCRDLPTMIFTIAVLEAETSLGSAPKATAKWNWTLGERRGKKGVGN